mgnify:CR=1 FL=1
MQPLMSCILCGIMKQRARRYGAGNIVKEQTAIYRFDYADMEWLQFVVRNRRGEMPENTFDMHIGPVADDNVYRSIRLFETGVLDADETVKRLKTEVLQDQWTFHTEKMLSFIHFISSKEIRAEE